MLNFDEPLGELKIIYVYNIGTRVSNILHSMKNFQQLYNILWAFGPWSINHHGHLFDELCTLYTEKL